MRQCAVYLDKAADQMKLERLKLITTFLIQSLHISLIGYKPFNPIIGETFQTRIEPPEGEKDKYPSLDFYAEQTSHHPPIMTFYGISKNYKIYGSRESTAISSGNSVISEVKGAFNIVYNDGTHVQAFMPRFILHGLIIGKRTFGYEGNLVVEDKTNNLKAIVEVKPKESKGFFKSIFSGSNKTFPDYFRGFIAQTSDINYDSKKELYSCPDDAILAKIEGEYNNYVNIDDKSYWDINNCSNLSGTMCRQEFTLPSDSQLRYDVILYKHDKLEMAQYAKMSLEDLQRKDVKLRKMYHGKH